MIDDKKIEDTFKEYNEKVEKELSKRLTRKPTRAERYADTTSRQCAFYAGAKWAINEFLKDLWHPASEEPEKNRRCLIRVVYHLNYGMLPDEERIEQSSFYDFGWYDYDFKYIGPDYDIISWLYVDDLEPKEGGEK